MQLWSLALGLKRSDANLLACRRSQAQAALDARNARYRLAGPGKLAALQQQQQSSSGSDDEEEGKDKRLRERLERAERIVGKFVAQTIQPAVQRARSTPLKGWVRTSLPDYFTCPIFWEQSASTHTPLQRLVYLFYLRFLQLAQTHAQPQRPTLHCVSSWCCKQHDIVPCYTCHM